MKKVLMVLLVLVVTGGIALASPTLEAGGKTLVFGSSGDAVRLDPADVTDGESIQRMDNIFEGLVEYETGSTEIKPLSFAVE